MLRVMQNDDKHKRDVSAAVAARKRIFADAAARDPVKLEKATRVVRAALNIGTLTVDDLVDQDADKAEKVHA